MTKMSCSLEEKRGEALEKFLDTALPFQLERSALRGRLVKLGESVDLLLRQHAYPAAVSKVLAEAVALAAALGSSLKFDGVLTVQTQTQGPIHRIVADMTSDGALRACAQFDAQALETALKEGRGLLGTGHLVLTLDQKLGAERYQGVVALEDDDLAQAFRLYFQQSEQIPTGLIVASAGDGEETPWRAGCLLLQRMPREGGCQEGEQNGDGEEPFSSTLDTAQEDDWRRAMALMQTCSAEELTAPTLSSEALLFRLFHEEGVRVYEPLALRHECRCDEERIKDILAGLSAEERAAMIQEDGRIVATCGFCSKTYPIDPQTIERP